MSFLKYESETKVNNLETKPAAKVSGYDSSDSTLRLEPVSKPVDTLSFDHNANLAQKEVCQKLKAEQPDLFSENVVIVKKLGNENQYKQMKQFSSGATVESLIDVMKQNNLVLRCNFIRPGFNARNSCLMCTTDDLKAMLDSPQNEFKIKSVKLNLVNDDELSPKHGSMFLSAVQDRASGLHKLYSLDYHIHDDKDKVLYCIH